MGSRRTFAHWFLLLGLSAALTGCASQLKVQGFRPAAVPFGAKRLSIVSVEGRQLGRERVIRQLVSQARAGGYYAAQDRSEERLPFDVQGHDGPLSGQGADEAFLRVVVDELRADRVEGTADTTVSGVKTEHSETSFVGRAALRVWGLNPRGRLVLSGKSYDGTARAPSEEESLEAATKMAVFALLAEVSPTTVDRFLRLDEDNDDEAPFLQQAKRGELDEALKGLSAYAASRPDEATAQYNLGVLLEADGRYEDALTHYASAVDLKGAKDFYRDAQRECERRVAEQRAGAIP